MSIDKFPSLNLKTNLPTMYGYYQFIVFYYLEQES